MGEMGVSSGLRTGVSLSVTADDILMEWAFLRRRDYVFAFTKNKG
jgi:hypothetical protein